MRSQSENRGITAHCHGISDQPQVTGSRSFSLPSLATNSCIPVFSFKKTRHAAKQTFHVPLAVRVRRWLVNRIRVICWRAHNRQSRVRLTLDKGVPPRGHYRSGLVGPLIDHTSRDGTFESPFRWMISPIGITSRKDVETTLEQG